MAKKKQKKIWFSSTIMVLIVIFISTVVLGMLRYGWEEVLDASLKYAIGASFTALLVALVGYIFRKQLSRLIKRIMR